MSTLTSGKQIKVRLGKLSERSKDLVIIKSQQWNCSVDEALERLVDMLGRKRPTKKEVA